MSGYCYSCASSFGTFNRALGCKNCGFAFCKKCLTKKTKLPQCNNAKLAVCNKCYDVLNGKTPATSAVAFEPPDAYFKRMAALENTQPQRPSQHAAEPQTANRQSPAMQKGLGKKDTAIAERLQKLKDATKPANVPSQSEIEARLGRLKQADTPSATSASACDVNDRPQQPHMFAVDRRTQQEQIDALLSEIGDEVEIDARVDTGPAANVRDRLNQAKSDVNTSEPLNDMNKAEGGRTSRPVDKVNIATDASCAGDTADVTDVERLMCQVAAELHVDAQQAITSLKKDKDLWNRVERLKQDAATRRGAVSDHGTAVNVDTIAESDSEDEETATKRIIQQLIEENQLDERSGIKDVKSTRNSSKQKETSVKAARTADVTETAELPWCCICNEDATLRCSGCDGDLYCQRCFKEGHDRWDIEEHKTLRYSAPVQSNR